MTKNFNQHKSCLALEESKLLMSIPKFYDGNPNWKAANNSNFKKFEFIPKHRNDDLFSTIPGVTVECEYKAHKRIKNSDRLLLTLHQVKRGTKYRAYQIESCSVERKSSHHDGEDIYGSHEHIGADVFQIPSNLEIYDLEGWFSNFCAKIDLEFTGTLPEIE